MVERTAIELDGGRAEGLTVHLPRTTLIVASTEVGYVMCGALDVRLLDERLAARGIVAARAVGVRTLRELLDAPIDDLTRAAAALGIHPGMTGREALGRMLPGSAPTGPTPAGEGAGRRGGYRR
jgi:uncharacterized protein YunC (DUF1805 family)